MAEMKIELEPTNQAPARTRTRLTELKEEMGSRFEDVALVLSELVSNSVRRAADGAVEVSVRTYASSIRLEVSDGGLCFKRDDPGGGGLGLKIVDKVARSWGIESDGRCTVWVEMELDES